MNANQIPHGITGEGDNEHDRRLAAGMSLICNQAFGRVVPRCDKLGFPEKYKQKPTYMIMSQSEVAGLPDGATPRMAPFLRDESDGTVNKYWPATHACGDSYWKMHAEYHSNGSLRYRDVSHGPGFRLQIEAEKFEQGYTDSAWTGTGADRGACIGAPCVMRYYFDQHGNPEAQLKLNDVLRPVGSEIDQVLIVFQSGAGDREKCPRESWGWGDTGDGHDRWVHTVYEEGTGRMLRMEKDDGCVQFYSGPVGREALRFATHDPSKSFSLKGDGTCAGVISESYKGAKARAYLTRRTFADGTIAYHNGTTPQNTPLRREWLPDGRMRHYKGPKNKEYLVRETFCTRQPDSEDKTFPQEVGTPLQRKQLGDALASSFPVGTEVRTHGLSRNDLNSRVGVVIDYNKGTDRFAVRFTRGNRGTFAIRSDNLVCESEFQQSLPFPVGTEVRPIGLSRNDLNNRAGVVVEFMEDTGRFAVCFGANRLETFNIRSDNLVTEAQFIENREARNAKRTVKQRERDDRRAAARLQLQQVREEAARAAAARAAAEATSFDPSVSGPVAPLAVKRCIRDMLRCPISREPMFDAVLASDGHVYSAKALHSYWQEHGFVSPLTDEGCTAVVLYHLCIRSIARDMADTPADAKWDSISFEEPDVVCCPITQEVMTDPVRAADGNVYDRASLVQWFATGKNTSPLTNMEMAEEVRTDLTMRTLCQAWL